MQIIPIGKKILKSPKKIYDHCYNLLSFFINDINYDNRWNINGKIYISSRGKIKIGNKFRANSGKNVNTIGGDTILRFVVKKGAELIIGNNVGISNSTFVCWDKIEIGDYVYIGGGCKFWDTDFHSIDPIERRHKGDTNVKTSPIRINNYAFVGGGSIILKGVEIGKNSVIAAGSVVTKSVPANEVWGGNPARRIKSLNLD